MGGVRLSRRARILSFLSGAHKTNPLKSFRDLNDDYNTMVSMMQVGMDMAPTPTQIATWKSDCTNYNHTVAAWKNAHQQITDFNSLLVRNHLHKLTMARTTLTNDSCRFAPK